LAVAPACTHNPVPAAARPDRAAAAAPQAAPSPEPSRPPYRPLHKGHIDLGNGLYFREDDDLFLKTAMPAVLRRTYNSGDRYPRAFGINTTHTGELWLHGDGDPRIPWCELLLADGGRVRFNRISTGYSRPEAIFHHDGSRTDYLGATMSWQNGVWVMTFSDGSSAVFHDCQRKTEHCRLLERRDAQGHRIEYVRDGSQTLLRITSEGQSISFEYDDKERIIRASDTSEHTVSYSYDDRGRLIRAESSSGTIRKYAYDDRNNLIEVREPGRIVRNWFDDNGRVSRQEVRDSDDDNDPWVWTGHYEVVDGSVVQIEFDEGNGLERHRFNRLHYVVEETFDADGRFPITFTYDRDELTNLVRSARLSCGAQTGDAGVAVPPAVADSDDAKRDAFLKYCVLRNGNR
jgi:YD repeat-containing protein